MHVTIFVGSCLATKVLLANCQVLVHMYMYIVFFANIKLHQLLGQVGQNSLKTAVHALEIGPAPLSLAGVDRGNKNW